MSELRQKNPQLYDFLAKNFENSPNRQKDFEDLQARMKQVESYPPPRPFPTQRFDPNSKVFTPPDPFNYKQQEHEHYMKRYLNDAVKYYADSISKLDKKVSKTLMPKKERKKRIPKEKAPDSSSISREVPPPKPRRRKQEKPQKIQQNKDKKAHSKRVAKIKQKAKQQNK